MTRRAIIKSSDSLPREINYSTMTLHEIEERIADYKRKYGAYFLSYSRRLGRGSIFQKMDLMDWEVLVAEKRSRAAAQRREKNRRRKA